MFGSAAFISSFVCSSSSPIVTQDILSPLEKSPPLLLLASINFSDSIKTELFIELFRASSDEPCMSLITDGIGIPANAFAIPSSASDFRSHNDLSFSVAASILSKA